MSYLLYFYLTPPAELTTTIPQAYSQSPLLTFPLLDCSI